MLFYGLDGGIVCVVVMVETAVDGIIKNCVMPSYTQNLLALQHAVSLLLMPS